MTPPGVRYYFGNISCLICCLHWRFHKQPGDRVVHLCRLYQTHHYSQTKDYSFAASAKWPENRELNPNPPEKTSPNPAYKSYRPAPHIIRNPPMRPTAWSPWHRPSTRCSVAGTIKMHVECRFTSSKHVGPYAPASCPPTLFKAFICIILAMLYIPNISAEFPRHLISFKRAKGSCHISY